jgi:LuxR family maltose regulon positive regulatory protein
VLIGTRSDPPFQLARLRARGQLVEVRAADLRFTAEEASAFLSGTMGLHVSSEASAALADRTEGWAAGLQLAALAMHGREDVEAFARAFAGRHRFILDYLVDEVLSRQPEPVQTFLVRTSILDRLCAPLCDAVLGELGPEVDSTARTTRNARSDIAASPAEDRRASPVGCGLSAPSSASQALLERLDAANLFVVPLDDERHWYRYHHLFAEALRHRLRLESPELIGELHRRASDWYAAHDLMTEAVEQALLARDWPRAASLIVPISQPLFHRGLHTTAHRWLSALPDDVRWALPSLGFRYGMSLLFLGEAEALQQLLDQAEPGLAASGESPALGMAFALRAHLAAWRADNTPAISYAERALALLPADEARKRASATTKLAQALLQRGDLSGAEAALANGRELASIDGSPLVTWQAFNLAGVLEVLRGRLHRAAEYHQAALDHVGDRAVYPRVDAALGLGAIHREWNDLDSAADYLAQAIDIGERIGYGVFMAPHRVEHARLLDARGDPTAADAALAAAEDAARRAGSTAHLRHVRAHRARLLLARGDVTSARRWADSEAGAVDDVQLDSFERLAEALTLARLRIAQGDPSMAAGLIARLVASAEAAGRLGSLPELLAVQALAFERQADRASALATLERALRLAEPEGYVRVFVDEGEAMAGLLRQMHLRRASARYVGILLRALDRSSPVSPSSSPLPEPPSEREREVLGLLAEGLSNREIAERLIIAEGTVKAHLHHLGGKLGGSSRTQVLARARELGLL